MYEKRKEEIVKKLEKRVQFIVLAFFSFSNTRYWEMLFAAILYTCFVSFPKREKKKTKK